MAQQIDGYGACLGCHMRCCTHFSVPLTGRDVLRISQKLGMRADEFAEFVDVEKVEQAPHENVFLFDEDGKMRECSLRLKKKAGGACVFFRELQGCGIHGFHPTPCRTYPFVAGEKNELKYNKNLVCPRKWKGGEYDKLEIAGILERTEIEIAEYGKIVRRWNAQKAKNKTKNAQEACLEFILSETAQKSG